MKKIIYSFTLLLLLSTCNNHTGNKPPSDEIVRESSTEVVRIDAAEVDIELSELYEKAGEADWEEAEKYMELFDEQLRKYLAEPMTFENDLEKLSEYIRILESGNKKVKFYSYDDLSGGSMRYTISYIQYKTGDGTVTYRLLEDAGILSDLYSFIYKDDNYYLLVSRFSCGGTCGAVNLRVFKKENGGYFEYGELFPETDLKAGAGEYNPNGSLKGNIFSIDKFTTGTVLTYDYEKLEFDPGTRTVSYDEFAYDEEDRLYPTGNRIQWVLQ